MSAEAIAYVFNTSPYRGTKLCVHLAIADVVNDAHENLFFMKVERLAVKAHCSETAARDALQQFVTEGFLDLVRDAAHEAKTYRFIFRANPDLSEPGVQTAHPSDQGVQTTDRCKTNPEGVQKTPSRGAGFAPELKELKRTQDARVTRRRPSTPVPAEPADDDDPQPSAIVAAAARLAAVRDYDQYQADRRAGAPLPPVRSYKRFLDGCERDWLTRFRSDAEYFVKVNPDLDAEHVLAAIDAYGVPRPTTRPATTGEPRGCDLCDGGFLLDDDGNLIGACPACLPNHPMAVSAGNPQGATA